MKPPAKHLPSRQHATRHLFLFAGAVAASACLWSLDAQAVCSDHAPASGATVSCNTTAPNPDTTGVISADDNITVNVLDSAGIAPTPDNYAIQIGSGTITVGTGSTLSAAGGSFVAISFSPASAPLSAPPSFLTNSGTITAANNDAVDARGPLHVVNNAGASISSISDAALDMGGGGSVANYGTLSGVNIAAVRIYHGGAVENFGGGTITGTDNDGVLLSDGSTLINHVGASISGANKGLEVAGAYSGDLDIISNAGTIISTGTGTGSIKAGVLLDADNNTGLLNQAGGTISGPIGVHAPATSSPIRLRNAGTITGTGGTAINFLNDGNTLTLISGFTITGNAIASGSANTDTLALSGAVDGTFDVSSIGPGLQYQGFDLFAKREASRWTLTNNGAQDWTIEAGTLAVDGVIGSGVAGGGTTTVMATGTLAGHGTINSQTVALNGGDIDLVDGIAGDVLTIGGELNTTGGILHLDADLSSGTVDRLTINGDLISGAPILVDIRILGASGAPTTGNGILLLETLGISPSTAFQLAGPVIAGAYRYDLVQAADNNWYLRALALTPSTPIPALNGVALLLLATTLLAAAATIRKSR